MNLKSVKIIAVDFDGTLCENSWPEIGEPNEELIEYLRNRKKDGDKLILWTCRVEDMLQKAVEWCKERNLVFDAVNENLPEIIENFGSDTRKIFANEYIDDRNIWPLKDDVTDVLYLCDGKSCGDTCPGVECKHTSDISHAKNFAKDAYDSYWEKEAESETKDPGSHEKSNMESWAEREVEIACKREAPDREPGEWDYGCACYESALKAFNSLCEDGHSGFSIGMTKQILNRLIECKPLTSIEDTEDVWDNTTDFGGHCGEVANYQCKRMSSLFKYVYVDGSAKYRDVNRFYGVNLDNPNASYHSGLIDRVMEEKFPITMPYFPESKPFYVYCEEFLTDRKNGDYDTVGILYIIKPDGERVEINRYFKEGEKDFVEIDVAEYEIRQKMHEERLEKMKKDCNGCFGAANNDCLRCEEELQYE